MLGAVTGSKVHWDGFMSEHNTVTIDGNQAAARIAHLTNEVIAIYPITPSSNM